MFFCVIFLGIFYVLAVSLLSLRCLLMTGCFLCLSHGSLIKEPWSFYRSVPCMDSLPLSLLSHSIYFPYSNDHKDNFHIYINFPHAKNSAGDFIEGGSQTILQTRKVN